MMEGTVTGRTTSKKGNPVIKIDGKAYVATKLDVSRLQIGDRISFDAHTFGDGNVWGMDSYELIAPGQKYPSPSAQPPVAAAPTASQPVTEGERLSISNWVGQAIAAGCIKSPEEIEKWVSAARNAIRAQS
jgi:hypothetical protein